MNHHRITPVIFVFILFFSIIPVGCSFRPDNNPSQKNYPTFPESNSKNNELSEISPSNSPDNSTPTIIVPPSIPTLPTIIDEIKPRDLESRIAFTGTPSDNPKQMFLYVMNEDGTEIENIANIYGEHIQFRWSPDGKKLAVSLRTMDSDHELFILDLETNKKTMLLQGRSGLTVTPYWSPNGSYIAYCNVESKLDILSTDGTEGGYVAGCAGNFLFWKADTEIKFIIWKDKMGTITFGSGLIETEADFATIGNMSFASWSPDGDYIVAIGYENVVNPTPNIFKYFTDGSHPINLTKDQEDKNVSFGNPLLSKSGDQIYFTRMELIEGYGYNSSIWVMNTDGTNKRLIIDFEGDSVFSPGHNYLSADGQKIAFSPTIKGDRERGWERMDIYTVNLDGTELLNLTQDIEMTTIYNFAWSP